MTPRCYSTSTCARCISAATSPPRSSWRGSPGRSATRSTQNERAEGASLAGRHPASELAALLMQRGPECETRIDELEVPSRQREAPRHKGAAPAQEHGGAPAPHSARCLE